MQLKIYTEPLLLAWPNLSPGLNRSGNDRRRDHLLGPGVKLILWEIISTLRPTWPERENEKMY